jgi:hypothetical protein
MSGTPTPPSALDIQEQIARISRTNEETRNYVDEQHKLQAEHFKLYAEGDKFNRERWLLVVAALGGVAGLLAALVTAAKTFGWMG